MGFIETLLTIVGITIGIVLFLIIAIQIILLILIIKFAKKHPILALFLLIVLIGIAIFGLSNPVTLVAGITGIITALIALLTQYRRLKKTIKGR